MGVTAIFSVMASVIAGAFTAAMLAVAYGMYLLMLSHPFAAFGLLAVILFIPTFVVVYFILIVRM